MQVITYVGWKLKLWIFAANQKMMALCMCKVQREQKYYRKAGNLLKCFHFVFKKNAAPFIQCDCHLFSFSWAVTVLHSRGRVERALVFTGTAPSCPPAECLTISCRKAEHSSSLPYLPPSHLPACPPAFLFPYPSLTFPLGIHMLSLWQIQYVDRSSFSRRLLLGAVLAKSVSFCTLWKIKCAWTSQSFGA